MLRIKVSQIGIEATHFTVEVRTQKWEVVFHVYEKAKLEKLFAVIRPCLVGKDLCNFEVYEVGEQHSVQVILEICALLQ